MMYLSGVSRGEDTDHQGSCRIQGGRTPEVQSGRSIAPEVFSLEKLDGRGFSSAGEYRTILPKEAFIPDPAMASQMTG